MVDSKRRNVPGRTDDKAKKKTGRSGTTAAGREFVDLVVAYAKQETLGPLKGLGKFVGLSLSGSILISIGVPLLLLALLRALQTETGSTFGGNLSWLPYLITLAAALGVAGLAAWRIKKNLPVRSPAVTNAKDRS
jgi:hypothetical protein